MAYLFPYVGSEARPVKQEKKPEKLAPVKRAVPFIIDEAALPPKQDNVERMPVPMPGSLWKIMREVCERHKCKPSELAGIRRDHKMVYARREYCLRARNETKYSLPRIGKTINKDHTTVIHAIAMASKGAKHYAPFKYKPQPPKVRKPYVRVEKEYNYNLTWKEKKVYKYIQAGMNNHEIAEAFGCSLRMARDHRYKINCKLKRRAAMGVDYG